MPLASLGAIWRHFLQILDEQGMSWRRYTSRTIFCTLPFLVDRTKILLEMLLAKGSASADRLRLVMVGLVSRYADKDFHQFDMYALFVGNADKASTSSICMHSLSLRCVRDLRGGAAAKVRDAEAEF